MSHQPYDIMLTIAIFLLGFWGVTYHLEHGVSMGFAIASAISMVCAMCYMFLVPKYAQMPDRDENKNLVRWLTEINQKIALDVLPCLSACRFQ